MRIIIVDDNDRVVGAKERDDLAPGDIYRCAALWLFNSKGEMLLQQRAHTKKIDPNVWQPAAAGTIEEEETYDDNIVKEIKEEIGLDLSLNELRRGPKARFHGRRNDFFVQVYLYTLDKSADEFVIDKDEVQQVRWMTIEEIKKGMREHPEEFSYTAPQWIHLAVSEAQ